MGRTDDLISRAAAIEAIGERPLNWTDTHGELQAISDWDGYIAAIKSVPAVDAVQVVHGRWLITTERFTPELVCSACGERVPCISDVNVMAELRYCPNCGAKMD